MAVQDENVQMVRLASIDKMDTVAVIEKPAGDHTCGRARNSGKGNRRTDGKEIEDSQKQIAECDEVFKKAASV